jgi:restriction system protein
MSKVTISRIGELLRSVFELLWNKPEGLPAREIIAFLPEITPLTDYEKGYLANTNTPRYERIVRLATIPLLRAGWLVKNNKGRWFITEEGRNACRKYSNAQELYQEALRLYEDDRQKHPSILIITEEAEEKAWEQVQQYLLGLNRPDFMQVIADLLTAMGYTIAWIAPADKDHGQIDMIIKSDPLGVKGPQILVQVKHKGQALTPEGLRTFSSLLGNGHYGLLVSSGGFTETVREEVLKNVFDRITLFDLEVLFDQWKKNYEHLEQPARSRLPIKPVHFIDSSG